MASRRQFLQGAARCVPTTLWSLVALGLGALSLHASASASAEAPEAAPRVTVVSVETIIQPVVEEFLVGVIETAEDRGDELVVIELSTPGGMLDVTRRITSAMLESETPLVVFVYPQGVHAASAGFFLLMASDFAAMAPGTNTGAAHPVAGQGQDIEGDMGAKVEQDTAAMIRSLAAARGRDEGLAQEAVLDSRSFTAEEALEFGLVDLIAPNLNDLLTRLDGREVEVGGATRTLSTRDATVVRETMSPFQRILSVLVHPNIALMLLGLGGLGLYVEISNPGAIFPGVFGAIGLILGLYATSVLPVNYAGLALLGLAVLLFLAEIKVPSFGLLTLGGIASLVLGSLMLFDSPDPALRVSLQMVIAMAGLALVVVGALTFMVVRSRRNRVATGREGLIGHRAEVRSPIEAGSTGKVFLMGEIWNARSPSPLAAGEEVEVRAVDGLTLEVERPASGVVD